ncbi:hypothetical protein C6X99_02090 [Bacillus pumilus]|nr:hypothetical protein C6X99_02090 [Bacillus pumilus]
MWKEKVEHAKNNKTLIYQGKLYSIAVFPQVYGYLVSKDQFYQEIGDKIIEESRMESNLNTS